MVTNLELQRFCTLDSMNMIYSKKDISLLVLPYGTKKYCIGIIIHRLHVTKVMTSKSEVLGSWLEKFHIGKSRVCVCVSLVLR